MSTIFTSPFTPAFALNGIIAPGATLTFYATGTSTPQNVYADSGQITSLGNVVIANAQGQFVPIYLDQTLTYRTVLKTATGAVLGDIDPVNALPSSSFTGSGGAALVGTKAPGTGAATRTVQTALYDMVTAKQYGVVGDAVTNDSSALANAVVAAIPAGALVLTSATYVGAVRPPLNGVQMLGNKPVIFDAGTGYGKTVANRRGRDLGQKVLGRGHLARLWNILSFFGVTYTATAYMTGDSVTQTYVGPLLQTMIQGVSGIASVVNNAITGTTIEQWRTGTGGFAASGKAMSDWIAAPTDFLYIAFGINTPYYGGTPAQFAASLDQALASIRAGRDPTQTSIAVCLPIASRDGGAMLTESGWKRDEYFVYALRELCEPLVDKYKICLYDPSVEVPEANQDNTGTNPLIWMDVNGVHPVFGHKYFLSENIFNALFPVTLRNAVSSYDGTAVVVPATGFTLPGVENMRTVRAKTSVISDGYVAMTTPATLTVLQSIATLAVNYSPVNYQRYVQLVLFNAGIFETIRGEIDNSTRILKASTVSTTTPQRIYCYGAWNAA